METSRDDVGIAIRSAFLKKGAQQRFSLFALVVLSVFLLFAETIETQPLNYLRSFVKDIIYIVIITFPFAFLFCRWAIASAALSSVNLSETSGAIFPSP